MKEVMIYEAIDGTRFDDKEQCEIFEEIIEFKAAIGLQPSDISEVLNGCQRELGDVLEKLGNRIAKKRLEAGGYKRRPAHDPENAPEFAP